MRIFAFPTALILIMFVARPAFADDPSQPMIYPASFTLHGKDPRQRVIVTATVNGKPMDATRAAQLRSETPGVVQVSADGIVTPVASGTGTVVAVVDGQTAKATVQVVDGDKLPAVTFEKDVQPILARAGCNAGACHGKSRGQNGFQLSLLGYDSDFDFKAITQEARGRRVFPAAPEQSLLLLKPSGGMSHGGGIKLPRGDAAYETLFRWIAAGTPRTPAAEPMLERITVEPAERL